MIKVKTNYPKSLEVYEGNRKVLIGSEIEPKLIGIKEEVDTWDNGPTTYVRKDITEYWVVIQDGAPLIIARYYQTGDYAENRESWEAYNLEKTLQVDRWLPKE